MSNKEQMLSVEDWLEKHYPNEQVLFSRRMMMRKYAEYAVGFISAGDPPPNDHLKHLVWLPILGIIVGIDALAGGQFYKKPKWFIFSALYQGACVVALFVLLAWYMKG